VATHLLRTGVAGLRSRAERVADAAAHGARSGGRGCADCSGRASGLPTVPWTEVRSEARHGGSTCLAGAGAAEEWRPREILPRRALPPGGGPGAPGWRELPVVESIEGLVVHSTSAPVGRFACSNDLFNRIHALVRWAQCSNLVSVLTDCPHRERLGWLEQTHLNGPALRYEFDLSRLLTKDRGRHGGQSGGRRPRARYRPGVREILRRVRDSPEWGSALRARALAAVRVDRRPDLLRRSYDMMKRYVGYLGQPRNRPRGVVRPGRLVRPRAEPARAGSAHPGGADRDGVSIITTPGFLSHVAARLGKPADAAQYEALAGQISIAFNRAFFDPATGRYATGSQCANTIPLVMDLVEPARRAEVLAAIVADVRGRGNALTAGDVGYRYLLRALADGGRSDVIFDMNNQSEKPGYGFQLAHGATSLTEAWTPIAVLRKIISC